MGGGANILWWLYKSKYQITVVEKEVLKWLDLKQGKKLGALKKS